MRDSEVTSYKTEIRIANSASKVMWSYNATANEHEGEKCKSAHGLKCLKGIFHVSTLNYVPTSFGIICYFVWHMLGGDHADDTYELPYVLLID